MIQLTHKLIAKSIREKLVWTLKITLTNFSLKLRYQSPCYSNLLKMFGLKCKWHQSYLQLVPWSCLNLLLPKVVEEVVVDIQVVDIQVGVDVQAEVDQVEVDLVALILVPIHHIVVLLICQVQQLVMLVVVLLMPQELQLMPRVP